MSAKAWVTVVIETTKLGTEEQDKLTRRPSAKRTIRFPFGQMMWSTWSKFKDTQWNLLNDIMLIVIVFTKFQLSYENF